MNLNPQMRGQGRPARRAALRLNAGGSLSGSGEALRNGAAAFLARRRVLVSMVALASAVSLFVMWMQFPATYAAESTLMIPKEFAGQQSGAAATPNMQAEEAAFEQAEAAIIRSPALLGQLADRLGLMRESYWTAKGGSPASQKSRVIQKVARALKVDQHGSSRIMSVVATSNRADQAAQIANTAVQLYLQEKSAQRFAATRAANAWLSQRISALKGDIQQQEASIGALRAADAGAVAPPAALEMQRRNRDLENKRAAYAMLLLRYETFLQAAPNAMLGPQIVAEALPPLAPASLAAPARLGVSVLFGLAAGLMSGLLAELFDRGIRSLADTQRKLGRNGLASIPLLDLSDFSGMPPASANPLGYMLAKPMSAFAESLRSLRTMAAYSDQMGPRKILCVSSAKPQEGKTTIALGLARIAAMSGQRVLIIDCDQRRQSLNVALGMKPKLGLLDAVTGVAPWRDVIIDDVSTTLKILPSTDSHFAPRDIFGSMAASKLLTELRASFDLIILDAPAMLATIDARSITMQADQTIMVAQWNKTPAKKVRKAIDLVESAGGQVAGVALNFVNPKAAGRLTQVDTAYRENYASRYYAS